MKQYKSPIEKFYFTKQYDRFNIELKNFIGFICRKRYRGFKQTTEQYENLYKSITGEIYHFLHCGHYEQTIRNVKMYRLLDATDKWNQFGYIYKLKLETKQEKKKFIKDSKFSKEEFDFNLNYLNIKNIEVKEIDFRSYLYTQINGELTKYFNKHNRERKYLEYDSLFKVLLVNHNDEDLLKNNNSVIIDNIIKKYNLDDITYQEYLDCILTGELKKTDSKIYSVKLISWVLFTTMIGRNDERYFI